MDPTFTNENYSNNPPPPSYQDSFKDKPLPNYESQQSNKQLIKLVQSEYSNAQAEYSNLHHMNTRPVTCCCLM
jgi:hypothetical protein